MQYITGVLYILLLVAEQLHIFIVRVDKQQPYTESREKQKNQNADLGS